MSGFHHDLPTGFRDFLNKFMKKEIPNFVTITNLHRRTDHIYGETKLFVEVCMNENYKSHECDQFKILETLGKLSSLYGEDSTGLMVSVIQTKKVFID